MSGRREVVLAAAHAVAANDAMAEAYCRVADAVGPRIVETFGSAVMAMLIKGASAADLKVLIDAHTSMLAEMRKGAS